MEWKNVTYDQANSSIPS
jgi:hypothetical protein